MKLESETVLLFVQQGLLGEVSPELRAVTIRNSDNHVHFDAYFDGPIAEEDIEGMSCVETELMALLPEDVTVSHSVHRFDMPSPMPQTGTLVHMRRE